MVVFILEKVPASVRGELSRWLLELRPGVFVGKVSALVRDELWTFLIPKLKGGSAVLIYPTNNEQGFAFRSEGNPGRTLRDFEGLFLISIQ
ncbi:type I-E CRISPR-associated endoribonuclease Cas2e [Anthocerotibacter panamensis]|uniref:type I-E CRISPR-associated endoribonuclease Cas2e n=1 Tax=Anthocerotibacter panamensis TaxID=2857077 RepID=UPI001C4055BA|nr:type I-E CRISPR-associated endoribonuclease Cas2e [Anthocerotibacter panamensis]